ncbi:MAG: hypothetical protein C0501_29235 [Isosphaera sp.]|nr:hypothetical protein [Isosphaera sp.]
MTADDPEPRTLPPADQATPTPEPVTEPRAEATTPEPTDAEPPAADPVREPEPAVEVVAAGSEAVALEQPSPVAPDAPAEPEAVAEPEAAPPPEPEPEPEPVTAVADEAPVGPTDEVVAAAPESPPPPPPVAEAEPVAPPEPEPPAAEAEVPLPPAEAEPAPARPAPKRARKPKAAAPVAEAEPAAEVAALAAAPAAVALAEPDAAPAEGEPAEPAEPAPPSNKRWYAVKVQSGREESIKAAIERKVKIEGLEEYFGQIVIPVEEVIVKKKVRVKNKKTGETTTQEKNVTKYQKKFHGYLFTEVEFNDQILYVFRETSGVGDFVGASLKRAPAPMTESEVQSMLTGVPDPNRRKGGKPGGKVVVKLDFEKGDKVRIKSGAFTGSEGEVKVITEPKDPTETPKVTVEVTFWGRPVPVEVDYWEVDKV